MNKNKEEVSLSWEEFQAMGNHNAAPDLNKKASPSSYMLKKDQKVRISLDKKGRKGKKVTIIKGLKEPDQILNTICRELKTKFGVGGSIKNECIILQGNHTTSVLKFLLSKGFTDSKISEA